MNLNEIEVRDTVEVVLVYHHNYNPNSFTGEVLYMPFATGDSWHIRDSLGQLRYVQNFAEIILTKKAEQP